MKVVIYVFYVRFTFYVIYVFSGTIYLELYFL